MRGDGSLDRKADGFAPFFIGKLNLFMMRSALNHVGWHSENTVIGGDRMDTDILAGVESGLETILVLTGVTTRGQVSRVPYHPTYVYDSVAGIPL